MKFKPLAISSYCMFNLPRFRPKQFKVLIPKDKIPEVERAEVINHRVKLPDGQIIRWSKYQLESNDCVMLLEVENNLRAMFEYAPYLQLALLANFI